jgi:hypothetical protein
MTSFATRPITRALCCDRVPIKTRHAPRTVFHSIPAPFFAWIPFIHSFSHALGLIALDDDLSSHQDAIAGLGLDPTVVDLSKPADPNAPPSFFGASAAGGDQYDEDEEEYDEYGEYDEEEEYYDETLGDEEPDAEDETAAQKPYAHFVCVC